MKVLKSFFIAAALLVSAFNVQAATTINLGEAYSYKVTGVFSHDYEFNLAENADITGVLWGYKLNGFVFSGISDFAYSLSNGVNTLTSGTVTGFGDTYSAFLTAGTYALKVSGNALPQGGYYGFDSTVSPVSEPAILALMLGGLAMIGFVAGRRKSKAV